ncbi:type III polyketide synthase [Ruicaihuangia caeni]|uniref:Type III polyketide synthase n=1 Tax=Ruicaihuangia caeni TaxID=3042517 RepID=A0AAW6T9R6_9MICO|nr:type III polyketide synthase [Klugiella sp. YN-L-19]MDI2098508.1 type III polyketide synthase [Klugiella sp. YN-L-19]
MVARIVSLETAVPETVLVQEQVRDVFLAQPGLNRLAQRLITTSFDQSGIERRHTVIDELTLDRQADDPRFFDRDQRLLHMPGTRERNELYTRAAGELFVATAKAAIDGCGGILPGEVTHIITVSCTGFFAPGPDFLIARDLGLRPDVQRYNLGFMGCYASMPALRLAAQLCDADPQAVVLVVSVELCTLHVRSSNDPDQIIAASLFADGAAAALVTARDDVGDQVSLTLDRFETRVTPVGEEAMSWTIGDEGFEMVLSSYVPHIIGEHIDAALAPLLERPFSAASPSATSDSLLDLTAPVPDDASGLLDGSAGPPVVQSAPEPAAETATATATAAVATDDVPDAVRSGARSDVQWWAVHPGGRSIVDRIQQRFELSDEQVGPSRDVLRDFGNMSSATVLFVLDALLDRAAPGDTVLAMAFGPGLTVESGLMTVR